MSVMDNGGPAFPNTDDAQYYGTGMTLRDWFAGQALPAIISATSAGQHDPSQKHGKGVELSIAMDAYLLADAMIAARGDQK